MEGEKEKEVKPKAKERRERSHKSQGTLEIVNQDDHQTRIRVAPFVVHKHFKVKKRTEILKQTTTDT